MKVLYSKTKILFLSAALALGLVACGDEPDGALSNVLMTAVGTVEIDGQAAPAYLELHHLAGGIGLEIYNSNTQMQVGSAYLVASDGYASVISIHDLLSSLRGPLEPEVNGSAISVLQRGTVEKPLGNIRSTRMQGLTQGGLRIDGGRKMTYNLGVIDQRIEGRVRARFQDASGTNRIFFDGSTVREAPRRRGGSEAMQTVVGTDVHGQITGSVRLGGSWFGGNDARLFLRMPSRSGGLEVDGLRQSFMFNPQRDVTPAGGNGQMRVTDSRQDYVRVDDSFSARIALNQVDVGEGKWASGQGDVRYHLIVEVRQGSIRVFGSSRMDATLSLNDGQSAEFHGSEPHIQTVLAW